MIATAFPTGVSDALAASDAILGKGPGASTCKSARSAVALTRTTCAGSHAFVSLKITARSTLVAGTLSKSLSDVLQIDAYAGQGSSGSPVFNSAGSVIGVVYGGARESAGRIVYAVPVDDVAALVGR